MLARSHKLLVETGLLEQVSKYLRIVSIPFLCETSRYNQPTLRHQGCY